MKELQILINDGKISNIRAYDEGENEVLKCKLCIITDGVIENYDETGQKLAD